MRRQLRRKDLRGAWWRHRRTHSSTCSARPIPNLETSINMVYTKCFPATKASLYDSNGDFSEPILHLRTCWEIDMRPTHLSSAEYSKPRTTCWRLGRSRHGETDPSGEQLSGRCSACCVKKPMKPWTGSAPRAMRVPSSFLEEEPYIEHFHQREWAVMQIQRWGSAGYIYCLRNHG